VVDLSRLPDDLFRTGERPIRYDRTIYDLPDIAIGPEDLEDEGIEALDFGKMVMRGFANVGSGMGWLAKKTGLDPNEVISNSFNDAVDYWNNSLSDGAKAELAKKFVQRDEDGSLTWGDAGLTAASLQVAGLAPDVMTSLLGGGATVKALKTFANPFGRKALVEAVEAGTKAGASVKQLNAAHQAQKKLAMVDSVLGISGFGAFEGTYAGAQNASDVEQLIGARTHEQLMEADRYREIFESTDDLMGMEERIAYAKETLMAEAGMETFWKSGAATAILGAPVGAYFGKALGALDLKKASKAVLPAFGGVGAKSVSPALSRGGAVVGGGIREGVTEAAQEATETAITLDVFNRVAAGDADILAESINAGVIGALAGGPMGGAFGAAGYRAPGVLDSDPDQTSFDIAARRTKVSEMLQQRLVEDIDSLPQVAEGFSTIQARENNGSTRLETLAMYELFAEDGNVPRETRGLEVELNDQNPDPLAAKIQEISTEMTPEQMAFVRTIDPVTRVGSAQALAEQPPAESYIAFRADAQQWVADTVGSDPGKLLAGHIGRVLSDVNVDVFHVGNGNFVIPVKSVREQKRLRKVLDDIGPVTLQTPDAEIEVKPVIISQKADAGTSGSAWQPALDLLSGVPPVMGQQGEAPPSVSIKPRYKVVGQEPGKPRVRMEPGQDKPRLRVEQGEVGKPRIRQTGVEPGAATMQVVGQEPGKLRLRPVEVPTDLAPEQAQATIDAAANQSATSPLNDLAPTAEQLASGNYQKGRIKFKHGLTIAVENPIGSVREGTNEDGTPWRRTIQNHYGYIEGVKGADGDDIDTFLGSAPQNPVRPVVVINQRKPDGSFDEHKVMLGFRSKEAALEAYRQNYPDENPAEGDAVVMGFPQFRQWLKNGDKAQPADGVPVTKDGRKEWAAGQQKVEALPENPTEYFELDGSEQMVPLAGVFSTKENRPTDPENAAKFMQAAARGQNSKRAPIRVRRSEDGRLEVVDGNATFKAAQEMGWSKIPVVIDGDGEAASSGRYRFKVADSINSNEYDAAVEMLPQMRSDQGPNRVAPQSARSTTAVKTINEALNDILKISYADFRGTPTIKTAAKVLMSTVNARPLKGKAAKDPEAQVEQMIEHMAKNILAIYSSIDPSVRERTKLWYEGGNRFVKMMADRYGISESQAAAAIAVLSPQNPWFANMSHAERVADAIFGAAEMEFSEEMTSWYRSKYGYSDEEVQSFKALEGKKLSEVLDDTTAAARWIRAFDEAHNERAHRSFSPEGGVHEFVMTKGGTRAGAQWTDYGAIGKAVSVLTDGRAENIHFALGSYNKVRSFYNNLLTPEDADFVTIDTHAVAAAMLRPLGSASAEALQAFGGAGAGGSGITGYRGTYAVIQEAYVRAASAAGVMPREMQSITWEASREMFPAAAKRHMAPKVEAVWKRYKDGEIEQEAAIDEILGKLAKPFAVDYASIPSDTEVGATYEGLGRKMAEDRTPGDSVKRASQIALEVAPRPGSDAASRWASIPDAVRFVISQNVAQQVLPQVLREATSGGSFRLISGGYMGESNPAMVLEPDVRSSAVNIAKMVGHVLNQESMMVLSEQWTPGTQRTDAVTVMLPEGISHDQISEIYNKLWEIEVDGEKLIGGHSTSDGQMLILNFSDVPIERFAQLVSEKLGGEYDIIQDQVYAAFVESKDYGYGDQQEGGTASGRTPGQGRIDRLRRAAESILEEQVRQFESSGSAPEPGPGFRFSVAADGGGTRSADPKRARSRGEEAAGRGWKEEVVGIHFSKTSRQILDGSFYGSGMPGAERARVMSADDPRIKKRVYAYLDSGTGIRPESGVGSTPHVIRGQNLYDLQEDPLGLKDGLTSTNEGTNNLESRVLDAGFDGYFTRNSIDGMGTMVILGDASTRVPASVVQDESIADSSPPTKAFSDSLAERIDDLDGQPGIPMQKRPDGWMAIIQSRDPQLFEDMASYGIWETLDPDAFYYLSSLRDKARSATRKVNRVVTESMKLKDGWNRTEDLGIWDSTEALLVHQAGMSEQDLFLTAQRDQNVLGEVLRKVGSQIRGARARVPESKGRERTLEKARDKGRPVYSLTDIVRGGFIVDEPGDSDLVVDALTKEFPIVRDEGWDRNAAGYIDRKVTVVMANGRVAEIQLWEENMLSAKDEGGGHDMYGEYRSEGTDPDRKSELTQMMRALYGAAEAQAGQAWAEAFGKAGSSARIFADTSFDLRPNAIVASQLTDFQLPDSRSNRNATSASSSTAATSKSQNAMRNAEVSNAVSPVGDSIIPPDQQRIADAFKSSLNGEFDGDRIKQSRASMDAAAHADTLLKDGWNYGVEDGEVVLHPAGAEVDVAKVEGWTKTFMGGRFKVSVHRTHREAPESLRKAMGFGRDGNATGGLPVEAAFDTGTGEVHVFANMIDSESKLHRVLTEEIVGHGGLRAVFGERLDQFLKTASIPRAKLLPIARDYKLDLSKESDLMVAREEYIAKLTPADGSMWKKLVAWMKQALRDLGINLELTDDEAAYLMFRAREAVLRGDAPPASFAAEFRASRQDQTETPQFKRWFGDSKVVDENGEPKIMYHGSNRSDGGGLSLGDIEVFDRLYTKKALGRKRSIDQVGSWFSDKPGQDGAGAYGSDVLYPVFLSVKNPWRPRNGANSMIRLAARRSGIDPDQITAPIDPEPLRDWLKIRGYDGIIFERGEVDGLDSEVVVALEPEQIKSATGNIGTFDPANPDIRFSIAAAWQTAKGTPLESANEAANRVIDRVIAKSQAQMSPGERLAALKDKTDGIFDKWKLKAKQGILDSGASIEALERMVNGGELAEGADSAWKSYGLTKNISNVMSAVIKYGIPIRDANGWFTIDPNGKGLAEILSPLVTKDGNLLRMWEGYAAARRAKQLSQQTNADGTAREKLMAPGDVDQLLALGREFPVLEQVFDQYQVFNRKLLDLAVDVGLLDADARDMWEQTDYVPFYRVFEDAEGPAGPTQTASIEVRSTGIKRLKGSDKQLAPILENITLNTANLIDKIYKHQAMKKIAEVGMQAGAMEELPQSWKPIRLSTGQLASALRKAGMMVGRANEVLTGQLDNVEFDAAADQDALDRAYVAVVERMDTREREQIQTLFQMAVPQGPDVVGVIENGKTKYYRVTDPMLLRTIKGMGAENFGAIVDMMRGFKTTLTTWVTTDPGFMMANFMRDVLSSWVTSGEVDFTPLVDSVKNMGDIWTGDRDSVYAKVMMAGGSGGGFYDVHPGDVTKTMMEQTGATVLNSPSKVWRAWMRVGNVSEQANRIAIAQAVLKRGGSMSEAAFLAQDVTNFTMHGDFKALRVLTQTVPFLNARIQGLYRLYRGGRDNPTKFFMRGMAVVGATVALLARNWDDERYEELADWQKDIYWHVFIGDQHFAIPKPFEAGVIFGSLPERMIRLTAGRDQLGETAKYLTKTVGETFAMNPIPQAFKPLIEQWANKSFFTGRDIIPFYQTGLIPEAQYRHYTSDTARLVADLMPDFAPEWMRSPTRIESLVRGYLGTMGMYVMSATDVVSNKVGGFSPPAASGLADLPPVRRFVRGSGPQPTRYETMLWDSMKEVDAIFSSIRVYERTGQQEQASEMLQENRELLGNRDALQRVANAVRDLNDAEKQIQFSLMPPEEKRRRLDAIQTQKNQLLRQSIPILYLDAR